MTCFMVYPVHREAGGITLSVVSSCPVIRQSVSVWVQQQGVFHRGIMTYWKEGTAVIQNAGGPPQDSCVGTCCWLYLASLFAFFDILSTLESDGSQRPSSRAWFIADRKPSIDLWPARSKQLFGSFSKWVREAHLRECCLPNPKEGHTIFGLFFSEGWGAGKVSNLTCTLGVPSQLIPVQWTPKNVTEVADADVVFEFFPSSYIYCLTKVFHVTYFICHIEDQRDMIWCY